MRFKSINRARCLAWFTYRLCYAFPAYEFELPRPLGWRTYGHMTKYDPSWPLLHVEAEQDLGVAPILKRMLKCITELAR